MREFFRVVFMNSRDLVKPWWPIVWLSLIGIPVLALLSGRAHGQENTPTSQPAVRVIRMKITAYCPCEKCCGKWARVDPKIRKTSAGRSPFVADGVASDTAVLPFGTKVLIPGVGERIVDDRLAKWITVEDAKKGIAHIDLRIVVRDHDDTVNLKASHQKAKEWGDPWLDVKVFPRDRKGRQ